MKKKNIILILFFLFLNSDFTNAQKTKDHLEPVNSIFDTYDFQFEYYSKVKKVLFKDLTDSPEIRFQVLPSFYPENVLDIEFNQKKDKYYLVYHICQKMIWNNDKWDKVQVDKYRIEIEKTSVQLVKDLFEIAIYQTRFPDYEEVVLDGTNYFFSITKFGLKTGKVWSPKDGSNMNKLVDIGYELIELAKSKVQLVKINNKLKKSIEVLITELKKTRNN